LKRLRKLISEIKGIDELNIDNFIENLNDNYDKFWYYLDEKIMPPIKQGPYSRTEIQEFIKINKIIDEFSLIWHPSVGWKVASHIPILFKNHIEIPTEVINCLEILKRENSMQPVFLKQGYLHQQKNSTKTQFKSRWVTMTKDSVKIFTMPGGKLKNEIKISETIISPKILQNKANNLAFSLEIIGTDKNFYLWSPFQKEVLEWITELRKLKYILSLGDIAENYIIYPKCKENETNLFVFF